jgi:glycosidase
LPTAFAAPLKLHVPSPDWRDQVIYFALIDRFADGDSRNNDQGAGEYAPGQRSRYQGGDLKGLTQRLDYIRGLGATALWITPPVANQWLNPSGDYAGYHGYWAENMMKVDKHLGSLADYRALSRALHGRGMYLVQDIVVNHMGNFFTYRDRWVDGDPARGWEAHDQTHPVPRPSQPPFDQNDPRHPRQRAAAIYHWTPDIRDYNDPLQEHNFQMSGLDDLNTENPAVRRALRRSFGHWIRQAGVDAFRVDTAFYVPPAYFADFLHATDPAAPGVLQVARGTGRKAFHVFGEGFGIDKPGQDVQARKIESYITAQPGSAGVKAGQALLPGMLNFPLYGALGDVFARGRPPAELADRVQRMMAVHREPHLMTSFVDNHDVDRFLAGGSEAGLRQALLAMFTLPGIPVIYYGTEQGFTEQRAAMFASGWGSGGRDRFDTQAPLYRTIAEMAALRRQHRVLSRGVPTVLQAQAAQPGALAWRMAHGRGRGEQMLVVFNTAAHETLLDSLSTGLPAGTRLRGVYGLQGKPDDQRTGAEGRLTLVLPPFSAQVWRAGSVAATAAPRRQSSPGRSVPAAAAAAPALSLAPLPAGALAGDFDVEGRAPPGLRALKLVLDGDLSRAVAVTPDPDGRWRARVDTASHIDPEVAHTLVAFDAAGGTVSESRSFRVDRAWQLQAELSDPAGDDHGPTGSYTYPTDPGWGERRQMDIRRVRVHTAGGALRVAVQTHEVSTSWNPANGFDHVAFTIFVQLPGQADAGERLMPQQDGSLPQGMRWHRRLRAHGWSNALFSNAGASDRDEGTPISPGAHIAVRPEQREVEFTLPAAALGRLPSLSGARLWVTTWDYDGGYRALLATAQPYAMGGAPARKSEGAPKVMDSSEVITLP